ncbi:MAG: ABC transporter ATP-binding protein [Anaerolineae bacterium]|nr:MAG: ABC transporter ATP-binding protein [Anaerolineae bacterium]MCL4876949.1 ABC transporter ATP-binding protein [Anaerolineae bacterium]
MLVVEDLQVGYGAIIALRGISFKVESGQVVTLIGANGAGKSTTLNTLSGLLKPRAGRILFENVDITGKRADVISQKGLVQVPEGRLIIAPMTVQENLEMGAYKRTDSEINSDIQQVFERFPRLGERRKQKAGSLSGGEQQMLAVGRALMMRPKLIMLDEPSMGLAPMLVNEVFSIIRTIKAQGTTILLVEQNARKALQVADYAYVLERGSIVKEGSAAALQADEEVIQAYLG